MEIPETEETDKMKKIKEELLLMMDEDQQSRKEKNWEEVAKVDEEHFKKLKEIVAQNGWLTISKVGEKASGAAWLLVQHFDDHVDFQEECLKLMEESPDGEVNKRNIAYLEDRVRRNKGLPQVYGTQFWTYEDGRYGPWTIEDPDKVDERRALVGLCPLAEYQEMMEKMNREELKIGDKISLSLKK